MKMKQTTKRFSLGIHALYLAYLFPVFLVITLIMGLNNFNDNYRIIEENFGLKLETVSLVAGAFLDGDPYLEFPVDRFDVGAIAWIPEGDRLIGFDRNRRGLVEIDPYGSATITNPSVGADMIDLAYGSRHSKLYGLDPQGGIYTIALDQSKAAEWIHSISSTSSGLAYHPEHERFYIWSNGLVEWDPETGGLSQLSTVENVEVIALDYSPVEQAVISLIRNPYRIALVDTVSGLLEDENDVLLCFSRDEREPNVLPDIRLWNGLQFDRILHSHHADAVEQSRDAALQIAAGIQQELRAYDQSLYESDAMSIPIPSLAGIAVESTSGFLFTSADLLMKIEPKEACLLPYGFWPGYVSELHPSNLSLLSPLRRITKKLDLTYLYTFYRTPNASMYDITYSLDANIDADHSYPGDEDTIPEDSLFDMYGRIYLGQQYLSEIVEWDEWGLLKTGYAPILNQSGDVNQVVGVDINVSIIESRTRIHFLQTVVLGVVLFCLTMIATFYVTRTMIQPILELNETALMVAAGDFGKQTRVFGSDEFRSLCDAFNEFSMTLEEAAHKRKFDNQILQFHTSRNELLRQLLRTRDSWTLTLGERWDGAHFNSSSDHTPISHVIECETGYIMWTGYAAAETLQAAKIQLDIAWIVRNVLKEKQDGWEVSLQTLQRLYPDCIDGFYFFSRNESKLYSNSRVVTQLFSYQCKWNEYTGIEWGS